LDTNILLEIALDQAKSHDAQLFIASAPAGSLNLSDLAFFSIGIKLFREARPNRFHELLEDVFVTEVIDVISLPMKERLHLAGDMTAHRLDFDDAYQFRCASHFGFSLVTFDADFNRTPLKCLTPAQALALVAQ
jgi:predicted nucleic acid-binding protein